MVAGALDPARDYYLVVGLPEPVSDVLTVEGRPQERVEAGVDPDDGVAALLLDGVRPGEQDPGVADYVAARLDADPLDAEVGVGDLPADALAVSLDGELLLLGSVGDAGAAPEVNLPEIVAEEVGHPLRHPEGQGDCVEEPVDVVPRPSGSDVLV